MSALSIQPTFPIFTETDGQPLENGYIWIGTVNLDPQVNPINVYWDAALTIAAPQPIRTLNGYPSRNGTPGRLYVNSDYSIRVQNSKGSMVYSAPTATERYSKVVITEIEADKVSFTGFKGQVGFVSDLADDDGSDWIGFLQAGTGAVAESVQDKLRQTVSVKDFGATGDGVTDDVAAVNAAIAYANSVTGSVTIYFPNGSYNLKAGVTQAVTRSDVSIVGENARIEAETGTIFSLVGDGNTRRFAIKGFFFNYPSTTVDVNATPISISRVIYYRVEEIRVLYAPAVMYIDRGSNGVVNDITGLTANVARNAIHLASCVVTSLDNVYLINDAGLQPANPATPYPNPPVSGNVFIRVTGPVIDTLYFKAGVLCNRYHRGFYATNGLTQSLLNIWLESCVFDYCYDKGVFIENLGSSTANIRMIDLYVQAYQGIGIHVKTDGSLTQNVWIVRPVVLLSGSHNIFIESTTGSVNNFNTIIHDPLTFGGNRLGAGGYDIYAFKSRVDVRGGRVGINSLSQYGISLQAEYGVYFDGCDQYSVTGVESGGATGSYAFVNNPASNYPARKVYDNQTVVGNSVSTVPDYNTISTAAVISGVAYTNTTPYKQDVSVYADVTPAAATVVLNGTTIGANTNWSGLLYPGDVLTVTTATASTRAVRNLA